MGQMDATQPVKAKLRVPMNPAEDASVGLLLKWSVSSAAESFNNDLLWNR